MRGETSLGRNANAYTHTILTTMTVASTAAEYDAIVVNGMPLISSMTPGS